MVATQVLGVFSGRGTRQDRGRIFAISAFRLAQPARAGAPSACVVRSSACCPHAVFLLDRPRNGRRNFSHCFTTTALTFTATVTSQTSPDTGTAMATYDANGVGFSGTASPLLSGITLTPAGEVSGWTWASGKTQTRTYDQYGQPKSYKLGDPTGTGISAGALRTIGYDGAGRIMAYSHSNNAANLDQSFAYDDLTRLVGANLGNSSIQYSYDLTGNRTSKVISGTAYNNTVSPTSNKLTQTQDVGGTVTIQYDAAGNITNDGVNTYTYSDRGRLSSVTTAGGTVNYRYNWFEQRAYKTGPTALIPTGAAYYVYDEAGKLLGEYDANKTPIYETIYLGTGANSKVGSDSVASPVGVLKQTGAAVTSNIATGTYNVYSDHLATPRVITRSTDEAIVWRWDAAEAFGATAPNQNPNALGAFVFNQRLPGQVFDAETGLFQNWHREYNARLGRYIQSDPIGLEGGINTYAYVSGNPLSFTDPNGLQAASTAVNAAAAGGGLGGLGGFGQNQSRVPPGWDRADGPAPTTPAPDWTKPSPYLPTWSWDGITWPSWMGMANAGSQADDKKGVPEWNKNPPIQPGLYSCRYVTYFPEDQCKAGLCPPFVTGRGWNVTLPGAMLQARTEAQSKIPPLCAHQHHGQMWCRFGGDKPFMPGK